MKRILLAIVVATLAAGCATQPAPSPPTTLPSPTSAEASPSPSPSAVPAEVECLERVVVSAEALSCSEAIDAALASIPSSHSPVVKASFAYQLPCPPFARCRAPSHDQGVVIVTSANALEIILVSKDPNGVIAASAAEPYSPTPAADLSDTVLSGQVEYTPPNADVREDQRPNPDHVICPNRQPCGP